MQWQLTLQLVEQRTTLVNIATKIIAKFVTVHMDASEQEWKLEINK
jgi:hypothetical protein